MYSLQASVVSVTVGNLYLNRPEPDEETFEIIGIVVRDDYNSLTGKANLAMLQVKGTRYNKLYNVCVTKCIY